MIFSERCFGIIVAGGYDASRDGISSLDFSAGDLRIRKIPTLPQNIIGSSMVVHNGTILLCGGRNSNKQKCLQMFHGTWKAHSTLNMERVWHSAVTTQTAAFIFGGAYSKTTYEYLPKESTKWLMGKTDIPGGFSEGYTIAVKSEQEIWLTAEKRILSFNVKNHTFQVSRFQLNVERWGQRCYSVPEY